MPVWRPWRLYGMGLGRAACAKGRALPTVRAPLSATLEGRPREAHRLYWLASASGQEGQPRVGVPLPRGGAVGRRWRCWRVVSSTFLNSWHH